VRFLLATAVLVVACNPSTQSVPTPPSAKPTPPPAAAAAGTAPATSPPSVDQVAQGRAAVQQAGCGGCHTIPGVPGANARVGPDLAGVASRPTIAGGAVPNTGPDDLKRWILNPPAVKPGTRMPNLGLSDEQATRIVAYLETLR
jgi:cytochrome c2